MINTGKIVYRDGEHIIPKEKPVICDDTAYRKIESSLLDAVEIARNAGISRVELINILRKIRL